MIDTTKPEALRLADALAWNEIREVEQAAAELRRLHAESEALRTEIEADERNLCQLTDELAASRREVEALRAALAEPAEQEPSDTLYALRCTLEIIAVGDSKNPQQDAANTLADLGFWRSAPHPTKPAEQDLREVLASHGITKEGS